MGPQWYRTRITGFTAEAGSFNIIAADIGGGDFECRLAGSVVPLELTLKAGDMYSLRVGAATTNNDWFWDGPNNLATNLGIDRVADADTCTDCLPGVQSAKVGSFQGLTAQWLVSPRTATAYTEVRWRGLKRPCGVLRQRPILLSHRRTREILATG